MKLIYILFLLILFTQKSFGENIRLFYTSSLNGFIGDCLCKIEPAPGFTKRHSLLKQLNYNPNKDILIETGDVLDKKYDMNKARAIYESYSLAGYHSVNLGINDLSYGLEFIEKEIMKTYPVFSSNIKNKVSTNLLGNKQYIELSRSGKKIGIITLSSPEALKGLKDAVAQNIEVADPIKTITSIQGLVKMDYWIVNYYGKISEATKIADAFKNTIVVNGYEKKSPGTNKYTKTTKGNRVYHLAGEGEYLGVLKWNPKDGKASSVEIILPDFDKTPASVEIKNIMNKYKVKD